MSYPNYKEGRLMKKYQILKDGKPVDGDYFVLKYSHDKHALKALECYADSVREDNFRLSEDLRLEIARIKSL